jgi:hypothetical protein
VTRTTPTTTELASCARCGHRADWHRHDDTDNTPPTDPACPFRCLGYDCDAPGPPVFDECDCPDYVTDDE